MADYGPYPTTGHEQALAVRVHDLRRFRQTPARPGAEQGSGCGFCARKAVHPDRIKARMIERGVWPIEEFKGTHSKRLCVCMACGELVTPRTDSVLQGQGGCPSACVHVCRSACW
jgi:hypothetical protein